MFRDITTLQDRINRLFGESYPAGRQQQGELEDYLFSGNWSPAVDIYEDENAVYLKADLPDVDPNEIDIRIEGNSLILRGERKFEKEVKKQNFQRIERAYGTFVRTFVLPHNVAADKVQANYKNGVLHLTLPKREEEKPKRIQIHAGSDKEREKERDIRTNQ